MKRIRSSMLCAFITCLILMLSTSAFAGSRVTALTAKRKIVELGNSVRLSLKEKDVNKNVSWKVLNGKNNVEVDDKRKNSINVIGTNIGTATIQAKVGKRKYIYTINITKPDTPRVRIKRFDVVFDKKYTYWTYEISPCENTYVPDSLILYNVWRMAEKGDPVEKLTQISIPLSRNSVHNGDAKVVDGVPFSELINELATYMIEDRITSASDDDGNTDFYYYFHLIKNNVMFTYKADPKEGEINYQSVTYIG